uniref:Uncharacterized protein n=1 Tax=Picea sitchensis TaxID=3332 RepID=D5A9Q9_PICSI|nr:unknown [Picea sitchensis]
MGIMLRHLLVFAFHIVLCVNLVIRALLKDCITSVKSSSGCLDLVRKAH